MFASGEGTGFGRSNFLRPRTLAIINKVPMVMIQLITDIIIKFSVDKLPAESESNCLSSAIRKMLAKSSIS